MRASARVIDDGFRDWGWGEGGAIAWGGGEGGGGGGCQGPLAPPLRPPMQVYVKCFTPDRWVYIC